MSRGKRASGSLRAHSKQAPVSLSTGRCWCCLSTGMRLLSKHYFVSPCGHGGSPVRMRIKPFRGRQLRLHCIHLVRGRCDENTFSCRQLLRGVRLENLRMLPGRSLCSSLSVSIRRRRGCVGMCAAFQVRWFGGKQVGAHATAASPRHTCASRPYCIPDSTLSLSGL